MCCPGSYIHCPKTSLKNVSDLFEVIVFHVSSSSGTSRALVTSWSACFSWCRIPSTLPMPCCSRRQTAPNPGPPSWMHPTPRTLSRTSLRAAQTAVSWPRAFWRREWASRVMIPWAATAGRRSAMRNPRRKLDRGRKPCRSTSFQWGDQPMEARSTLQCLMAVAAPRPRRQASAEALIRLR